jgi:hypothetical protein
MKRILEIQKEIGVLGKDSSNPFYKSAYLDLNKLLTHVSPLLHKNNLILVQPILCGDVWSRICDVESGEVIIESSIELPDIKDPQKLGSAITYFRRYTLKSLLAIAEGDDDSNLASSKDVNLDNLNNCNNLKELQDVYTSLTKPEQLRLVKVKDNLKQTLK